LSICFRMVVLLLSYHGHNIGGTEVKEKAPVS
jgi:hypothetical protein